MKHALPPDPWLNDVQLKHAVSTALDHLEHTEPNASPERMQAVAKATLEAVFEERQVRLGIPPAAVRLTNPTPADRARLQALLFAVLDGLAQTDPALDATRLARLTYPGGARALQTTVYGAALGHVPDISMDELRAALVAWIIVRADIPWVEDDQVEDEL